jgi:hypothetical protein
MLRYDIVNTLLKFIFNNFPDCKKDEKLICEFKESGSSGNMATLDSDYDLTLNGHFKISTIIRLFNSIFEKEFGFSSAYIFDTNLYGYSFILPENIIDGDIRWSKLLQTKHYGINTDEEKNINQDKWAILRLISFLNNDGLITINNDKLLEYFSKNNITDMDNKKKQEKYLEEMLKFEELMSSSEKTGNDNKLELIESLSNMNYYGDETYFTQGAFLHVVGLMYLSEADNKNSILKKSHLIHSMIENLAYFIHSIKKGIIYAIKYFHRFINALILYIRKLQNKKLKGINNDIIQNINDFSLAIKENIRNRNIQHIRDHFACVESYMTTVNKDLNDLDDLKSICAGIKVCLDRLITDSTNNMSRDMLTQSTEKNFSDNDYCMYMLNILKICTDDDKSIITSININVISDKYSFTLQYT